MCGICVIMSIPIKFHDFAFNFLCSYTPKSLIQHQPLNHHILNNKLLLSNNINLQNVIQRIGLRGPDMIRVTEVGLKDINQQKDISKLKDYQLEEGCAIAVQSTLHLRGNHIYQPNKPGSFFLYNGEIWHTGNLQPINQGQNDSEWLHQVLLSCKGDQQQMLTVLRQIRGDFAIILIQNQKVFIMKDYFGKRSLLVGMSQNHLVLSSLPIENDFETNNQEQNGVTNDQEQQSTCVTKKYQAQWLSSKQKRFFQIPSNSLITINLALNKSTWRHHPIICQSLQSLPKSPSNSNEILFKCKQLLIQSIKQLTFSLKDLSYQNYAQDKIQEMKKLQQKKYPQLQQDHVRIAVLFSGGVDSTIIARILDIVLPQHYQIDLVNLAFRNDAPDRESGKISFQELQTLSPHRKYNLILVDKTLQDVQEIKKKLANAIYPKTTHMDFNIASALHIASKQTKAKIILTGLGADQIFSGYSRYRIANKRGGLIQTQLQMLFDMDRLWIRNLGRDDRAISINAKQVRYPFLYLPLWFYLRTVQIHLLTQGQGEKTMLRNVAREFGLEKASMFKKKAIQFGTRLAKLSNVKCFGSNRKAKGTYQYK